MVSEEWFESQYTSLSRTMQTTLPSNFIIEWDKQNITKKEREVNLGIKISTKRNPIYDDKDQMGTNLRKSLTSLVKNVHQFELKRMHDEYALKEQELTQRIAGLEIERSKKGQKMLLSSLNFPL